MKTLLAYGLSVLLHPLLVPTYLVAVLCYALPAGAAVPAALAARGQLVLAVWVLTFWLPALLIWGMKQLRLITSVELYERRQRPLPLLVAVMGFAAATLRLAVVPHAGALAHLLAAITASVFLTLLITFRWKISAHGVGMGGAVGLFAWLLQAQRFPVHIGLLWLLAMLVLAAAVAWARLALRAHTKAQVVAGLALGTAVAVVVGLR